MKLCCCTKIENYDLLVESGYDAITLSGVDITKWSEEEFRFAVDKLRQGPLEHNSINSFCEGTLRLHGTDMDMNRIVAHTRKLCERAAVLGFRYIGIGAPASRNLHEGEDPDKATSEFILALRSICQIAQGYGIEIMLESVCSLECNFLITTREAEALIRQLQIPNLHLVYDIFHEWMEGQDLAVITECANRIRTVHIAQLFDGGRGYLQMENLELYMAYWSVLKACGYHGDFSVEAFLGDPVAGIRESARVLSRLKNRCP